MALILEDGTGKADAQSYTDEQTLMYYCQARGTDAIANMTPQQREVLLVRAMDYLEGKADKFKGYKTSRTQALQWPRADVGSVDWPYELYQNNCIPYQLINAQLALAVEAFEHDLMPTLAAGPQTILTKKRVEGVVELAYENTGKLRDVPAFAKAEVQLKPLYRHNGLRMVRS